MYKLYSVLDATEFICCMSSGKRASRFLKDKFTVHRFCFLPLSNVFSVCVCHSLAVFVRDVVSCMGNYISILCHNIVIPTTNSKNWVTFCAFLQSLNCTFNMQYVYERPKQFQSMDEERIAFHDNKLIDRATLPNTSLLWEVSPRF